MLCRFCVSHFEGSFLGCSSKGRSSEERAGFSVPQGALLLSRTLQSQFLHCLGPQVWHQREEKNLFSRAGLGRKVITVSEDSNHSEVLFFKYWLQFTVKISSWSIADIATPLDTHHPYYYIFRLCHWWKINSPNYSLYMVAGCFTRQQVLITESIRIDSIFLIDWLI